MTGERRVVIVGSGPAGATAALKLLERGVPVTMLESGAAFSPGLVVRALGRNLYRDWAPPADQYAFVASGDPDARALTALLPGGLSNYWTGAVPRFAPEDFYEGERLHERFRWPLGYDDLSPYYAYAEHLLGVVGERRSVPQSRPPQALVQERRLAAAWQAVARYAEQHGQGLAYAPLADGPRWMVRRSGAAFNSFSGLVQRLARFPHFELRLGAHAQRVTTHATTGRVDGVEYVDRQSDTIHQVAASGIVVAAGPLASPKLLLQSVSREFPSGLGNGYGVLGHFLHDHSHDWCVLELDRAMPRLDQPLHLSRAPYAESAALQAAQITLGPLSKWDRILSLTGATTRRFGVVTFGTMVPEEQNFLRLHPSQRDQFGMPVLDIHMRYAANVPGTVTDSHTRLMNILEAAGLHGRLECAVDKLVPGSSAHYGGGARMHASPVYGVLDGFNRVHGAENVVVVDASSFTTGVEKNPTLTVMALAARAAERLAQDIQTHAPGGERRSVHAVSSVR